PPTRSAPGPRARAPRRTARGRASARGAPYRSPRRPASDAMLTYDPWHAVPGLRHGFLGRSNGDGWDAAVAREGVHLPVRTARQVHGTRVEIAAAGPAHAAGGLVTATPGQRVGDATAPAWSRRDGRLHLDLRAAARLLLTGAGTSRVAALGPCTACGSGYSSYRRDGAGAGRQLSFVGWASPPPG